MNIQEKRISDYFENETQSLLNRYSNIESLIPKVKGRKDTGTIPEGAYHTAEEGRFLEEILKTILNKHLPKGIRAITGFILRPASQVGEDDNRRKRDQKIDLHSPQLDIIVYDTQNFPVFESFGDFAIVPPEGVIGIVSVKKNLYLNQVEDEIQALKYSASLCWNYNYREDVSGYKAGKDDYRQLVKGPVTALLTFKNKETQEGLTNKIFDLVKNIYDEKTPSDGMIKQISVINEFTLYRGKERIKGDKFRVPFIKYDHTDRINFAIQMLLRSLFEVYYDRSRSPINIRPGYIHFDIDTLKNKEFNHTVKSKKSSLDFEYLESTMDYLTK
tara:strand:- start:2005 stop:2994 length:990 start_codon:yes stop_codon:yes gene_type:complete